MGNIKQLKQDLEEQLNQAKEVLHENKGKFDKEVQYFLYLTDYLFLFFSDPITVYVISWFFSKKH